MQRRKFIRNTAASAVALPGLFSGLNVTAYGDGSMLHELYTSVVQTDHILVIIQMAGGNDGLNTVIPLDQYSNYFNARSNIAIPENKILALTGTNATGLNPALTGLRDLYNDGKLCIVQSAGYPTPNFSHFRATDIWMSASNQDEYITNGWLGRYLNLEYNGYPNGYPTAAMPDPLAIQFGSSTSLAILGPNSQMGVTITDPTKFLDFVNDVEDAVPNTPAGERLAYVRQISKQSEVYTNKVKNVYNAAGANIATYPNNTLANQLKIVARLINGGLKTKIYAVNFSSFDTHAGQVNTTDHVTGTHANLLAILGDSVKAFHSDLKLMNKDNKVIGMTFSEFGRRIKSNASDGTDHGAAAPMFLFGTPVTGGIVGSNPVLPAVATVNDNIPYQTDFRVIYASLLKRWLCQDDPSILAEMFRSFPQLDICSDAECTPQGLRNDARENLVRNYPNPAYSFTNVEFKTDGGHTLMQLVDKEGHVISTIMEKTFDRPTTSTQKVDMSGLPFGLYYIRFQNGEKSQMKAVLRLK